MPRTSRLVVPESKTAYHVISRTALDGFPFGDVEKDQFVMILKRYSNVYFAEIMGFTVMDNHFHLLVTMHPEDKYSDDDIKKRFKYIYGKDAEFPVEQVGFFRKKWSNLSEFIKDIKQTFSRFYNKMHSRRGTLWGERFKSVIVQNGETLVNCLAYIDLNPVRAGIVKRPENYRWSSIGYHAQTDNKDDFLSLDFGLIEFGNMDVRERFRQYRRYLYEAGSIREADGKGKWVIDKKIVEKERENNFRISKTNRLINKSRYFTDSGIIGSKEFVTENYQHFKHLFQSKHDKKPTPVKGVNGLYSLKRLLV